MTASTEDKQLIDLSREFSDLVTHSLSDDREKTYDFWKSLRKANHDYRDIDITGEGTFVEFMEGNYGIKLYLDEHGHIKASYDIVDDHQYLLFKLKYA